MPIAPPSTPGLPSGWSKNGISGTTVALAGTAGMTVTGTGDKGLNLIGHATVASGLAGVFIQGTGDEGVVIDGSAGTNYKVLIIGLLTLAGGASAKDAAPQLQQLSPKYTINSGALPTQQFASGTGAIVVATRDVEVHTPVTFNPGVATTATCKVELSPDNTTYSELVTVTKPVGVVFDGTIEDVVVRVPANWWLKLTVNAQATLGLSTYY